MRFHGNPQDESDKNASATDLRDGDRMPPDDPRHGTKAGHKAGCRQQCCRDGAARYERGRQWDLHNGRVRRIPAIGVRRRVEALACLGWPAKDIADRCGFTEQWLHNAVHRQWVRVATHNLIASVYDELSMRFPPQTTPGQKSAVTRARRRAERNGWAPPLAWDDIDHDDAPAGEDRRLRKRRQIDTVLVDRVVAGEHDLIAVATVAEREAIVARFRAAGMPLYALEVAGIKPDRYRKEDAA